LIFLFIQSITINVYFDISMDLKQYFDTPITRLFGIKHPVLLAGMNVAAGPQLAAAVTNCGGLGVIGGLNYTPKFLRMMIRDLRSMLVDKDAPFGVDLLLPKVGDGGRKTNKDYTNGQLDELIDVIIDEKVKLFVSAVGVPPQYIINKLHNNGVIVMNMVGAPKHAEKAIALGVDIICAQGTEGGGHTGDIGTTVLVPAIVDLCKQRGIPVVAAGGVYDGRGLAAALCMGAAGVWVGTRFVACIEASAPSNHKQAILDTGHHETFRTFAFTGRSLRIGPNEYARDWELRRSEKMKMLLAEGIVPAEYDQDIVEKGEFDKLDQIDRECLVKFADKPKPYPHLMGQVAGSIRQIKSADEIMEDIVVGAATVLGLVHNHIIQSKL
jgi:NAD(P)H-dependent flavin oxidoreductase YrpB (nitropropane dioxygenase family)